MSLWDCPKCWEIPCSCGYEYKDWDDERLIEFLTNVLSYKNKFDALRLLGEAFNKMQEREEDAKKCYN